MNSIWTCLILTLALLATAQGYSLDGSWDFQPLPGQFQHLKQSLTFQFKRDISKSQTITNKLFIYNCFLSQLHYQIVDDHLRFSFISSSLLSPGCNIEQIDQIKKIVMKTNYFEIQFDRLVLRDLAGRKLLTLVRQKIQYRDVLVGTWMMTSQVGGQSAIATITSSSVYLCQGAYQLDYTMQMTNGSYPVLLMKTVKKSQCADAPFGDQWAKAGFFMVAANRSQLSVYGFDNKYMFRLDQVGRGAGRSTVVRTIDSGRSSQQGSQQRSQTANSQTANSQGVNRQSNQNYQQQSQGNSGSSSTQTGTARTTTSQTTQTTTHTTSQTNSNTNTQSSTQRTNVAPAYQTTTQQSASQTQTSTSTTQRSTSTPYNSGTVNPNQPSQNVQAISQQNVQKIHQGSNQQGIQQNSQRNINPNVQQNVQQNSQQNVNRQYTPTPTPNPQQNQNQNQNSFISNPNTFNFNQNANFGSSSFSTFGQSNNYQPNSHQRSSQGNLSQAANNQGGINQGHQGVSSQGTNQGGVQQRRNQGSGNQGASFDLTSGAFAGNFEFVPVVQVQPFGFQSGQQQSNSFSGPTVTQTFSTQQPQNIQQSSSSSSSTSTSTSTSSSTSSSQSTQGTQPQPQPQSTSISSTHSTTTINIGRNSHQNNIVIQISLHQFIQQAKWAIHWMKGLTSIPSVLQRTYIVFTPQRLILYCPCNTYYTEYILHGNQLKNTSWSGTQNKCGNSQDVLITGLVFYSKILKQEGQNLAFYFNDRTKLAQFEPFF